jgi:arginine/ornithine N-succinyltransferase beta subunit
MKRNLLFVTYHDGELDEGLNYALDLAKMTDKGMAVLLVNRKKLSAKFEELMSAVAFAEENEPETAQQIMKSEESKQDIRSAIEEKCKSSGVTTAIYTAVQDAATSVKDYLKKNSSVDMVLLSPNITEDGNISSRDLSRLVRTASRPIVTMAKQPQTA